MARRREVVVPVGERATPPAWIQRILPALVEFHRLGGKARPGEAIPEGFSQWWREAQRQWCRDNGCHRVGKTCEQAGGRPCVDRRPAGAP